MCSISIFIVAFSLLNLSVSVYANQPIVRFKNRTVGILTDVDAGVFTATDKATILGDLEVKATNKTANIIEEVDSLIRLQSNVELRVNTFAQHANMSIVCNPEGTEYRKRNFETGEFGECVCKEGYTGETCIIILPHQYWRYRLLEKEYAWNVKEIQFFPDTEFYDETQSTVGAPHKERGYGSGSKCIQSGQYGGHGCDRSFDDNLYSWWSNWASGDEAQSWIGIDLGSTKPVKHVRFMNGRGWPAGKEGVIEFSDDMNTWTEWSGGRITTEARASRENEGSKNNTWQEAAVFSAQRKI